MFCDAEGTCESLTAVRTVISQRELLKVGKRKETEVEGRREEVGMRVRKKEREEEEG